MRIGFFDSGIGGISVLHDALKRMPGEDYLYYADQKHVPYGAKTKKEVRRYVMDGVDFLIRKDVDALVIACNTATSVAIGDLRKKYAVPIIGMEPAVKPAIETPSNNRVLVTATVLTLKEKKLKKLITALEEAPVDFCPCGSLSPSPKTRFSGQDGAPYLEKELGSVRLGNTGQSFWGCRAFHFFRDLLRKIVPPRRFDHRREPWDGESSPGDFGKRGCAGRQSGSIVYFESGEEVTDDARLNQV
jgi:glutamate racemase